MKTTTRITIYVGGRDCNQLASAILGFAVAQGRNSNMIASMSVPTIDATGSYGRVAPSSPAPEPAMVEMLCTVETARAVVRAARLAMTNIHAHVLVRARAVA